MGKNSLLPSIFNINEPLAFGILLVMNPSMLVPMLLNPILCGVIAYVGFASGWVNPSSSVMVVWTVPRAAAALMCGGIRLMGLQLLVYISPFFGKWTGKHWRRKGKENEVYGTSRFMYWCGRRHRSNGQPFLHT